MALNDYFLIARLIFFILLLLTFLVFGRGLRKVLEVLAYSLFVGTLSLLVLAQGMALYVQATNNLRLAELQTWLFGLVVLMLVASLLAHLRQSYIRLHDNQDMGDREKWLREIYEKLPAAVFVEKNQRIIYSNKLFQEIQKKFVQKNPFYQCKQEQQTSWLTSPKGERFSYWVARYALPQGDGWAYLATENTATQLQRDFISKVLQDLDHHGDDTLVAIVKIIHDFFPSSLTYVARFEADTQRYTHLAHRGDKSNLDIYSDLKIKHTLGRRKNHWHWMGLSQLCEGMGDHFISQCDASHVGGVSLCDEEGRELGIILVLQNQPFKLNELLKDFLSVLSLRVRFELEHIYDKHLIKISNERYQAFIDRSDEAIADIHIYPGIHLDDEFERQWAQLKRVGKVNDFNPAFGEMFNTQANVDIDELLNIKSLKHAIQYVFQSGYGSEKIDLVHRDSNNQTQWLSCSVMADIEDGLLLRLWLIISDITQSRMHIQNLENQTRFDALTGLPNRLTSRETLEEKIDQAQQFGFKVGLLLIDLDRFKEVNDTLGHHYGDVLLKKIEPRIRPLLTACRGSFARLGGDEFAVIIPSLQCVEDAQKLAQDILMKIREPFDLGQLNVVIGGSIGISLYPQDGGDTSTLFRCADVAMYQAKKHPGGILYYRQQMDENSPRRLALMSAMERGISEGQFFLLYQPKFNLDEHSIHAAEALIRWQHPEMGLVSPGEFIPIAELSDVIIPMTQWVIDEALKQIQKWLNINIEIKVSVNVSTRNLLDDGLLGFIEKKLREYEVPARLFELEITESALMADPERALYTLIKISEMGVSISVDDFGTGHSSLVYLRQLPIDALKVDIMFVRNMCTNKQDEIIVNSIINLAHNLSLTVVAEGAEDRQTLDKLHDMSCDLVQGFYVSKPVTGEEFIRVKETWDKGES